MEILPILLMILISIVGIAFFITSIVFLIKFSSQNPKTLKTAKRAAFFAPIGLGWIGVLLYFITIKPAVKNDQDASGKVKKSFIWGIVTMLLYIVLVSIFTVVGLFISSKNSEIGSSVKNRDHSQHQESPSFEDNFYSGKKYYKYANNEGSFTVELPCVSPLKQDIDNGIAQLEGYALICASAGSATTVFEAESPVFGSLDEAGLSQALDEGIKNIGSSSPQFAKMKIISQNSDKFRGNVSRELIFESEDFKQKAFYRAFFIDTAGGRKMIQFITLAQNPESHNAINQDYTRLGKSFQVK
ncbi:MAG: hypothetical protein Q4A21_01920 [bacterium]|nr:hypothetical protein [bacterium]